MNRNCGNCGWSEIIGSPIMCHYNGHRTWRDECCEAWKPKEKELLKEQQKDWITDKLPDKPGLYLCTFYGDSIMENYVAPCEYICKPYHAFNKFLPYDYTFGVSEVSRKDLTNDVIAWMPFPEPYNKLKEE